MGITIFKSKYRSFNRWYTFTR